jgi:hypothetical protein
MLNKKDFIKIMEDYKQLDDNIKNIDNAFKKLDIDFGGFALSPAHEIIGNLLKLSMEDENDWIGYYIYELNWGRKYEDGCIKDGDQNIKLQTLEDLYRLLSIK